MNFSIVTYTRLSTPAPRTGRGWGTRRRCLAARRGQLAVVPYADDAGVGRETGELRQEFYVPQGAVGVPVVGGVGRFDSDVAGGAVCLGRLDYHVGVVETSESLLTISGIC